MEIKMYELQHRILDNFLEQWGNLEKIKNMDLKDYAGLFNRNSFTYWIEYGTYALGSISGSYYIKTGLFESKNKNRLKIGSSYYADGQFLWYKRLGETKEEALIGVKKRICQIIDAVRSGDLEQVDKAKPLWELYRWKIAFLYQDFSKPIRILPIFSKGKLSKYLGVANSKSIVDLYEMAIKRENIKTLEDAFAFVDKVFNNENNGFVSVPNYKCNPIPKKRKREAGMREYDDKEYSDIHCRIQKGLAEELLNNNFEVFTESPHGNGKSLIDIVATKSDKTIYYEIKPYNTARACIREALGQLMEYWYYVKKEDFPFASELIIVGPADVTYADISFIQKLREKHGIPLDYRMFNR